MKSGKQKEHRDGLADQRLSGSFYAFCTTESAHPLMGHYSTTAQEGSREEVLCSDNTNTINYAIIPGGAKALDKRQ